MPRDGWRAPVWTPADIEEAGRDPAPVAFVPARNVAVRMRGRAVAARDRAPAGLDVDALAEAVAARVADLLAARLAPGPGIGSPAGAGVEGGPPANLAVTGPSGAACGSGPPLAPFPDAAAARAYLAERGIVVRRAAGCWWHGDQDYTDAALIAWAGRKRDRAARHGHADGGQGGSGPGAGA